MNIPVDVLTMFEQLSLDVKSRGFEHYSADAILHQIRWRYHMERGDREFKCNNNWTPVLARWFLARHPDCRGFFALRESPVRYAA